MAQQKEPFVGSSDRPNTGLNPDTPISELRVRDLQSLMQGGVQPKTSMEKLPVTEKHFKSEMKLEKVEQPEKQFKNELKLEKLEWDGPPGGGSGNPGIDQLIQTVSKLTELVAQLNQEVVQLKQQSGSSGGTTETSGTGEAGGTGGS